MTPRLDIFFDFLECDGVSVLLGDNRECKIRGLGKVRVQLRDGSSFLLHNVRYILELKRNLISLGNFEKEGYAVKLKSGKVNVINGSKVVLSGTRRDNCVYSLDSHAVAVSLMLMLKKKTVLRRRVWVYILRLKHKAFGKFKEWKQLVENQTGRTVKKLRIDNGTPQQNGLAERMNRNLMDKVRCLLIQYGLPKTFWGEATCTAAYLINRSPSTAIEKNIPMEMWSGHPVDYGTLRIFGCVAYPHDKQGKLDPRAVKCVLLGYPEDVKGHRLEVFTGRFGSVSWKIYTIYRGACN
ncbi:retrovirus-related pol polyprotein from transposon TNT 1-94 [Tanacetum coccineum]